MASGRIGPEETVKCVPDSLFDLPGCGFTGFPYSGVGWKKSKRLPGSGRPTGNYRTFIVRADKPEQYDK